MIPIGEHTALVCEYWWEANKKDGTPVLVLVVELADDFGVRERIVGRIWFTEKSASMARAQLKALGFDVDRHGLDEFDSVYRPGREVVVTIVEDNYQGRTGTKIGRFGKSSKAPPPAGTALSQATARRGKVQGKRHRTTESEGRRGVGESKRKPLSRQRRFDVFKRDRFACQYCGRTPPVVVLEVDHIIPVSGGGTNDLLNLTTSCFDCNRGKAATPLDHRAPTAKEQLERVKERRAQVRAYNAVILKEREDEDAAVQSLATYWGLETGWPVTRDQCRSLRAFIKKSTKAEVLESIDIALRRKSPESNTEDTTWRYFCGVCWRKIKGGER